MNGTQAKLFMDALEAANIKVFEYDTDLCTHLYNDGVHAIVKPDYDHDQMIAFRANAYGGSTPRYAENIQVVVSDFGDIHEVRAAGSYDQITKFIESIGTISLSEEEMNILLKIDKANYDIIPETGDYVNRFRYLSTKAYEALSPEEKADYDERKEEYEKKQHDYIGHNMAASVTL